MPLRALVGDRVWVCTREPLLNALGAPLHPCVILMVLFAALTFGKWRRERWRRLAHDLWRYLLVAAVLVSAFFLLIALLTRLAFGADPSPLLRWVSVARGLAAALAGWLVWQRRDTALALSPGPVWWFRARWLMLGFVLMIAARPWFSSTAFILSWPYELVEVAVELPTFFVASDECLAARVMEYDTHRGLSSYVGQPARRELEHRGAAAVPGMARVLSEMLDLDALKSDFRKRNQGVFESETDVYSINQIATFGAKLLVAKIAKYGGDQFPSTNHPARASHVLG